MNTRWIKIDRTADLRMQVREAAELIKKGELVAFPTETVYGLGADAMNKMASARIYAAKGRPSDNPLIVHICDLDQVSSLADDIGSISWRVMEHFWPGPLTVILKKKEIVPDQTTGGLATVAIRMPSHPVAEALIRESGTVIAAPSANISGRPSPTTAQHVFEDMDTRIPMILDAGTVGIGIESTILDMTGDRPVILRPGYISKDQLAGILGDVFVDPAVSGREARDDIRPKAPGMKYRHYAPKGQLILFEGEVDKVAAAIRQLAMEKTGEGFKVGVISTDESADRYQDCPAAYVRSIGRRQEPESIAASLYGLLRDCDQQGLDYILSESFFEEGIGDAVMNRMLKAAAYHLIEV